MVKVGRYLEKSSCPAPLLKQGHLELVAQGCVQVASECPWGWRLCSLSGQPVPELGHPHNKSFHGDHEESLCLCPLYLLLSLGTTAEAASLFSPPSLWILHVLIWSLQGFSWLALENNSVLLWEMLQRFVSGPSPDSLQCVCVSYTGELRTGHSALHVAFQCWVKPVACWQLFHMQPRIPLIFLASRARWFVISLVSIHQEPWVLFCQMRSPATCPSRH